MAEIASASEILRQHRLLQGCIERLGAAAWPSAGGPTEAEQLSALGQEAAQLRKIFIGHFALEEQGGYLEPVIAKRPSLSGKVLTLKEQHAEILSMLGSLERQFQDGTSLADARESVLAIVGLAARHEVAETDLIQKTLVEDIGAGD